VAVLDTVAGFVDDGEGLASGGCCLAAGRLGSMSEPYRTNEPPPEQAHDAELERLVQTGVDRRRGVASSAEREADRNLRHAIGRYRGSTRRRIAIVIAAVVVALAWSLYVIIVPNPFGKSTALINIPVWVTILAVIAAIAVSPYASKEAIAAEEHWVASMAFRLEGYFAAISRPPRSSPTLEYKLVWGGDRIPAEDLLVNLISTVTSDGKVMQLTDTGATLRDWVHTRKGVSSISVVPPRIHDMIEKVLVPLHRSYPIEHVTVTVPY